MEHGLLCYATPYKSTVLMNIQVWALTDAGVGHYISFLLSRHLRAEEREPDYTVVFQRMNCLIM